LRFCGADGFGFSGRKTDLGVINFELSGGKRGIASAGDALETATSNN
jgi:hypothetical protein